MAVYSICPWARIEKMDAGMGIWPDSAPFDFGDEIMKTAKNQFERKKTMKNTNFKTKLIARMFLF